MDLGHRFGLAETLRHLQFHLHQSGGHDGLSHDARHVLDLAAGRRDANGARAWAEENVCSVVVVVESGLCYE